MMEDFPEPFGVTSPQSSQTTQIGSQVDVVVSGVQTGWASTAAVLSTGSVYFTNTLGAIIKSSYLYGREDAGYFVDSTTGDIASANSRVGFAASTDGLIVQH